MGNCDSIWVRKHCRARGAPLHKLPELLWSRRCEQHIHFHLLASDM